MKWRTFFGDGRRSGEGRNAAHGDEAGGSAMSWRLVSAMQVACRAASSGPASVLPAAIQARPALMAHPATISSRASGDWFAIMRANLVPHPCLFAYLFSRFTAILSRDARFSAACSVLARQ